MPVATVVLCMILCICMGWDAHSAYHNANLTLACVEADFLSAIEALQCISPIRHQNLSKMGWSKKAPVAGVEPATYSLGKNRSIH